MAKEEKPVAPQLPKASPFDHGVAEGMIRPKARKTVFNGDNAPIRSAEFRAAETLHGWSSHQNHTADDFTITADDFKAAIEAAKVADKAGNYSPHKPALAPHLAKGA